jgi:hypothetical protein
MLENPQQSGKDAIAEFVRMYKDGAQGCEMDYKSAQFIARTIQCVPVMIDLLEDVQQEFADRYDGAPDAKMQWMGDLMLRIEAVLRQANG